MNGSRPLGVLVVASLVGCVLLGAGAAVSTAAQTGGGPVGVSPEAVDFGEVPLGDSPTRTVTVTNEGDRSLEVTSVDVVGTDAGVFTVDSGSGGAVLEPGATLTATVGYRPVDAGPDGATLSVAYTLGPTSDDATVSLSGTGAAPEATTPDAIDLGDVPVNASADRAVTVENTGSAPLTLTDATITGANATVFSVSRAGDRTPIDLAPGETTTVSVSFAPTGSVGNRSATLELSTNDPDAPTATVGLSGTSVGVLSGTVTDFGSPVADATVVVEERLEGGPRGGLETREIARTTTAADGTYSVLVDASLVTVTVDYTFADGSAVSVTAEDVPVDGNTTVNASLPATPAGGLGTEQFPYRIETYRGLQVIRDDPDAYYELVADLNGTSVGYDAVASPSADGGRGFTPIGSPASPFTGTFDGNGHTIEHLTVDRPTDSAVGLFGTVGSAGAVTDVTVRNVSVTGGDRTGALVGNNAGSVIRSDADGTVTGADEVGGLVGTNPGSVRESYATTTVTGGTDAGGLVGTNAGTVRESYAVGTVTAASDAGGLVGTNLDSVRESYAIGPVTATDSSAGGLVAENSGTVTDAYWNTETTGQPDSAGGTGLVADELRGPSVGSATTLDFTGAWTVVSNRTDGLAVSYPFLRDNPQSPVPGRQTWFDDGSGTAGAPYEVATWDHLDNVRWARSDAFVLTADLSETTPGYGAVAAPTANGGAGFRPIAGVTDRSSDAVRGSPEIAFSGAFDGNGHAISGLTIDRPDEDAVGPFGRLDSAAVRDVALTDVTVAGANETGGLAGSTADTEVTDVALTDVTVAGANETGGLAGSADATNVTDVTVDGHVTGTQEVGGLIGSHRAVDPATWKDVREPLPPDGVTGSSVTGRVDGTAAVGGLVGHSTLLDTGDPVAIHTSRTAATVTGHTDVGGVVGVVRMTIANRSTDDGWIVRLSATGNVTGHENVGGLVGRQVGGGVYESWTTGDVDGAVNVGGIVGSLDTKVLYAYSTGNVTGRRNVGGAIGHLRPDPYLDTSDSSAPGVVYTTGTVTGTSNVGGLVGTQRRHEFSRSYTTADVHGTENVGGAFGHISESVGDRGFFGGVDVADTYAVGRVTGDDSVGGLVGTATDDASVTGSYWNVETTGQPASARGTAVTTSDLFGYNAREPPVGSVFNGVVSAGNGTVTYPYPDISPLNDAPAPGAKKLYAGGTGTEADPYRIETWYQLDRVRRQLPAHFELTADLNETTPGYGAVAAPTANGGAGFEPIAGDADRARAGVQGEPYTGSFDGNGHAISGLTIDRPDEDAVGLFGRIGSRGTVRNVSLRGGSVVGANATGGLAGRADGTVAASYATTSVTGESDVGGLVGTLSDGGTLTQTYTAGPVTGSERVGGLVGAAGEGATVSASYWDELATGQPTSAAGSGRETNDLTGAEVTTETALAVGTVWGVEPGSPGSYPYLLAGTQSPPRPSDTASPTVETFTATGQPGQDVRVTLEASERLSRLRVSLGGPEQATYTLGAFAESATAEGYRYALTHDGDTDGRYAVTLVGAEDLVGNDVAGLFDTATVSQASETFDVTITGTSPDDAVRETETLSVTATVENVGDGIGTQTVELRDVDGDVVDGRSVSLVEDSRRTVTLAWSTGVGDAGSGSVTVASATDTDSRTVTVTDPVAGPTAEAGENRTVVTGYTTTFDGPAPTDATGNETYEWAFGDGTAATGPTPTHAYERPGTYTVTLTVTDADGLVATDTATVTVLEAGSGTPEDPYVITTVDQLQAINASAERRSAHYELGADVDASETSEWNDGRGFEPIGWYAEFEDTYESTGPDTLPFTGTLDGNGHAISGLTVDRPAEAGLFHLIGAGGEVRDVTLVNVRITDDGTASALAGGIAAWNNGTVTGVTVTGDVTGDDAGGVVGVNFGGTVAHARSSAAVTSDGEDLGRAGGLVGYNSGRITDSSATGTVSATTTEPTVGGLVGTNVPPAEAVSPDGLSFGNGSIHRSYATGDVTGAYEVGGLVGKNGDGAVIDNSYATGDVSGTAQVGGLVGVNAARGSNGTVERSYATGSVSGDRGVGGLVGYDSFDPPGVVTDSYWDTDETGRSDSTGGTGYTTGELTGEDATNTTNLDFETVWGVRTGDRASYPYLRTVGLTEYPTPTGVTVRPGTYFTATVDDAEAIGVDATVTNDGTEPGTQTVTLRDGSGAVLDSRSVSLGAGESTPVAFDWPAGLGGNATGPVSVATGNVTTPEVPVRPTRGNVSVAILGATSPTTEGDPLAVAVTVTNTDTGLGRQRVSLADFDGTVVDSQPVTLAAGASRRVTLAWATAPGDAGTGTITVASLNDTATRDARVASPGANDPPVGGADRYAVAAGEVLSVDAPGVLANDGDPDGDTLSVTPTPVRGPAYGTVDLSANGSFTYTPGRVFTAAGTADGVAGSDSFTYEVTDGRGGADTVSVALSVRGAVTQAVSNLSIGGAGSTATVVDGDAAGVVVRVRNVGTEATTVSVRVAVGERVTRTRTVGPVPVDGSVRVDVENVTTDLAAGRYPVTVSTADDTATGLLRVVSPTPLPGGEGPPTDPDGDGLYEDVDGDGAATYADVVALFEAFASEAVAANGIAFDFNRNGRLDFDDLVTLYRTM